MVLLYKEQKKDGLYQKKLLFDARITISRIRASVKAKYQIGAAPRAINMNKNTTKLDIFTFMA
jgi:hypothetical protein